MPGSAAESRSDRGKGCAICRRGDRDRFKFHNIFANISLVSRDTVPNQITLTRLTMAARYSCTILVSVGTRHCAQCVDSLCSYLGDSDTHNAGLVGNQDLNQHVKRRTLHVCVGLSDFRQRLTADYTTGPVCCLRRYRA